MKTAVRRDAVLGQVRRCPRCRDWWPDDDEFFYEREYTAGAVARAAGRVYVRRTSGVVKWCKACHASAMREVRKRQGLRTARTERMTGHCQTVGCMVLLPAGRDFCHGCAGRERVPLTHERIRELMGHRLAA